MRKALKDSAERCRLTSEPMKSRRGTMHGAFLVAHKSNELRIISSGVIDKQWEHVSVSLKNRMPNWEEMCLVKDMFWGEEETVVQFHPPKKDYVNLHEYVLHLWKNNNQEIILPPRIYV